MSDEIRSETPPCVNFNGTKSLTVSGSQGSKVQALWTALNPPQHQLKALKFGYISPSE